MRDALANQLAAYEEEATRTDFVTQLNAMEEWLYSDGENANKGVYTEKLEALQVVGQPISTRAREFEMLPDAFTRLEKAMQLNAQLSETKEKAFDHISLEERAAVPQECDAVGAWLEETRGVFASASKLAMPPVTVQQVDEKTQELNLLCQRIMNKPKPPPPTPPPKAEKPKKEGEAPADTKAAAAEGDAEGAGPTDDVPMDGAEEGGEKGEAEEGNGEKAEPCEMDAMD